MNKTFFAFAFLGLVSSVVLFGAAGQDEPPDLSRPKTLDGIYVQAVESYINPKHHELSFGVGLFPFNAYYNGFSADGGYTFFFNSLFAWEVMHGSFVFSVQKDLTSQLAERYFVNPQSIEKLEYVASTNLIAVLSYGKGVFFRRFLQYSRSSLLGGVGLVKTSTQSKTAVSVGMRFDGYLNNIFSWRLEVRDAFTLNNTAHFVSFSMGTGIYF